MTGLELVDEVRESAERVAARGCFAEAFERLGRATSLLADLRLRRFGIRHASGTTEAYELLADRGDPLGRHFVDRGQAVRELLDRLRSSHGGVAPAFDESRWAEPFAQLVGRVEDPDTLVTFAGRLRSRFRDPCKTHRSTG